MQPSDVVTVRVCGATARKEANDCLCGRVQWLDVVCFGLRIKRRVEPLTGHHWVVSWIWCI